MGFRERNSFLEFFFLQEEVTSWLKPVLCIVVSLLSYCLVFSWLASYLADLNSRLYIERLMIEYCMSSLGSRIS
jgi:hypothetical protein